MTHLNEGELPASIRVLGRISGFVIGVTILYILMGTDLIHWPDTYLGGLGSIVSFMLGMMLAMGGIFGYKSPSEADCKCGGTCGCHNNSPFP